MTGVSLHCRKTSMMRTTTSSGGSCRNAMQSIGNLGMLLVHEPNLLPIRLSAVASLQNIAIQQPFTTETVRAITALVTGLYSRSPLVRQRCILALGKSRYSTVISALREAVKDNGESTSLRVTALRGLGFGRTSVVETEVMIQLLTLAYNEENESKTIRDAAEVTAARLGWERSLQHEANIDVLNNTNDLAPPFFDVPEHDPIQYFTSILCDETESLFSRCRAMTNLRNLSQTSVVALPSSTSQYTTLMVIQSLSSAFLNYQGSSVFLRYQIILVLGQIKHKMSQTLLLMLLKSSWEDELIRATAAEALLLYLGEEDVNNHIPESLRGFEHDDNDIVKDCVRYALELAVVSSKL